jgi:RNA polymerase sigma-70 factor (ECF subfamily)
MSEVAVMAKHPNPPESAVVLDGKAAERLRADLVAFLARRTGDPVLAQDLAQETLVHVLRGLPRFRGAAALRTWARRIALNVWRDHLRDRTASPVERATQGDQFSVDALLDSLGPTAPALRAEDVHDRRATHDCLLDAVRKLPLAARRLILLHDFGEMPLEQAAAVLGCSVGTAKVRLHRARRRLAETCRAVCVSEVGLDGTTLCTPKRRTPAVDTNTPAAKAAQKRRR